MSNDDDLARGGGARREFSPPPPPADDPMGPPTEPCECWCMHCNRTFMSTGIWFQRVIADPAGFPGFWMCPTPNCGGAGFGFDIFPTDPDHLANEGWSHRDDYDESGEVEGDGGAAATLGEEVRLPDDEDESTGEDADAEWDAGEPKWKSLDEGARDFDDDIEGEEWKHGLEPGERPPMRAPQSWPEDARLEWEAEQRSYDEPDRRPRQVDWSDRENRRGATGGHFTDDDIPF